MISNRVFAIIVILMFLTSGVSVSAAEQKATDAETEVVDYSKKAELTDDDYTNPQAYPKIIQNPVFNANDMPADKIETYANDLTDDQIRSISDEGKILGMIKGLNPDKITILTQQQVIQIGTVIAGLEPEKKKALTAEQLSNAQVISNAGDLSELDSKNIEKALQTVHGVTFTITVAQGVTYKEGILFNERFLVNFEELEKIEGLQSITAVEDPESNQKGWTLITDNGEYQIITADAIGTIKQITVEDGKTKIVGSKGTFELESGNVRSIVDDKGRQVFIGTEGTVVKFGSVELRAEGSKNKQTVFDFTGEENVVVTGAVTVKSTGPIAATGVNHGGRLSITLDKKKNIESLSADKGEFKFERLIKGKRVFDGSFSGDFDVSMKDGGISEFILNDKNSHADINGVGKVRPGEGRLPLVAKLQTGSGDDPSRERVLIDGNGAAISQLLKIRHGLSSFKEEIYEKIARGETVELDVYELDGAKVKTTKVSCSSRAECDKILNSHYNVQKLDKVMEKLNNQQQGSALYLARVYDAEAEGFELGDVAGRGLFTVDNDKYGTIQTKHGTASVFYRSEPAQNRRAFYIDSHDESPGDLGRVDWKVPIQKGDRTIRIWQSRVYEVDNEGRVYYKEGKEPIPEKESKDVLNNGKDPSREFVFRKKEGRTEALLRVSSITEQALFNNKELNLEAEYKYDSGRNIKLFHNFEPTEEEIKDRNAVSNVIEINPETNRISLAIQQKDITRGLVSNEQEIRGAQIQDILKTVRTYRGITGREYDILVSEGKIGIIIADLKKKYKGDELKRELERRGIVMQVVEGKEKYSLDKNLIEGELRGYIPTEALKDDSVGLVTQQFREAVGKESAYGALFEGISNSEFGYSENAKEWFKAALDRGINKPTGVKALVDEMLKGSNVNRFKNARDEIDAYKKGEERDVELQLEFMKGSVYSKEGKFDDERGVYKHIQNVMADKELGKTLSDKFKKSMQVRSDDAIANSWANEFLKDKERTELTDGERSRIYQYMHGDSDKANELIRKITRQIMVNKVNNEVGKAEFDDEGTTKLVAELEKRVKGERSEGERVSSADYKTLGEAMQKLGRNEDAEVYFRLAEETLGDEATDANYDSSQGFNFKTFSETTNSLGKIKVYNYKAMERSEDIVPTAEVYLANSYDVSVGGVNDNGVRNILAESYSNLAKKEEDDKKKESLTTNSWTVYLDIADRIEKGVEQADENTKNALKQQMFAAVEGIVDIDYDVLSSALKIDVNPIYSVESAAHLFNHQQTKYLMQKVRIGLNKKVLAMKKEERAEFIAGLNIFSAEGKLMQAELYAFIGEQDRARLTYAEAAEALAMKANKGEEDYLELLVSAVDAANRGEAADISNEMKGKIDEQEKEELAKASVEDRNKILAKYAVVFNSIAQSDKERDKYLIRAKDNYEEIATGESDPVKRQETLAKILRNYEQATDEQKDAIQKLAEVYILTGNGDGAVDLYKKIVDANPNDINAQQNLALLYKSISEDNDREFREKLKEYNIRVRKGEDEKTSEDLAKLRKDYAKAQSDAAKFRANAKELLVGIAENKDINQNSRIQAYEQLFKMIELSETEDWMQKDLYLDAILELDPTNQIALANKAARIYSDTVLAYAGSEVAEGDVIRRYTNEELRELGKAAALEYINSIEDSKLQEQSRAEYLKRAIFQEFDLTSEEKRLAAIKLINDEIKDESVKLQALAGLGRILTAEAVAISEGVAVGAEVSYGDAYQLVEEAKLERALSKKGIVRDAQGNFVSKTGELSREEIAKIIDETWAESRQDVDLSIELAKELRKKGLVKIDGEFVFKSGIAPGVEKLSREEVDTIIGDLKAEGHKGEALENELRKKGIVARYIISEKAADEFEAEQQRDIAAEVFREAILLGDREAVTRLDSMIKERYQELADKGTVGSGDGIKLTNLHSRQENQEREVEYLKTLVAVADSLGYDAARKENLESVLKQTEIRNKLFDEEVGRVERFKMAFDRQDRRTVDEYKNVMKEVRGQGGPRSEVDYALLVQAGKRLGSVRLRTIATGEKIQEEIEENEEREKLLKYAVREISEKGNEFGATAEDKRKRNARIAQLRGGQESTRDSVLERKEGADKAKFETNYRMDDIEIGSRNSVADSEEQRREDSQSMERISAINNQLADIGKQLTEEKDNEKRAALIQQRENIINERDDIINTRDNKMQVRQQGAVVAAFIELRDPDTELETQSQFDKQQKSLAATAGKIAWTGELGEKIRNVRAADKLADERFEKKKIEDAKQDAILVRIIQTDPKQADKLRIEKSQQVRKLERRAADADPDVNAYEGELLKGSERRTANYELERAKRIEREAYIAHYSQTRSREKAEQMYYSGLYKNAITESSGYHGEDAARAAGLIKIAKQRQDEVYKRLESAEKRPVTQAQAAAEAKRVRDYAIQQEMRKAMERGEDVTYSQAQAVVEEDIRKRQVAAEVTKRQNAQKSKWVGDKIDELVEEGTDLRLAELIAQNQWYSEGESEDREAMTTAVAKEYEGKSINDLYMEKTVTDMTNSRLNSLADAAELRTEINKRAVDEYTEVAEDFMSSKTDIGKLGAVRKIDFVKWGRSVFGYTDDDTAKYVNTAEADQDYAQALRKATVGGYLTEKDRRAIEAKGGKINEDGTLDLSDVKAKDAGYGIEGFDEWKYAGILNFGTAMDVAAMGYAGGVAGTVSNLAKSGVLATKAGRFATNVGTFVLTTRAFGVATGKEELYHLDAWTTGLIEETAHAALMMGTVQIGTGAFHALAKTGVGQAAKLGRMTAKGVELTKLGKVLEVGTEVMVFQELGHLQKIAAGKEISTEEWFVDLAHNTATILALKGLGKVGQQHRAEARSETSVIKPRRANELKPEIDFHNREIARRASPSETKIKDVMKNYEGVPEPVARRRAIGETNRKLEIELLKPEPSLERVQEITGRNFNKKQMEALQKETIQSHAKQAELRLGEAEVRFEARKKVAEKRETQTSEQERALLEAEARALEARQEFLDRGLESGRVSVAEYETQNELNNRQRAQVGEEVALRDSNYLEAFQQRANELRLKEKSIFEDRLAANREEALAEVRIEKKQLELDRKVMEFQGEQRRLSDNAKLERQKEIKVLEKEILADRDANLQQLSEKVLGKTEAEIARQRESLGENYDIIQENYDKQAEVIKAEQKNLELREQVAEARTEGKSELELVDLRVQEAQSKFELTEAKKKLVDSLERTEVLNKEQAEISKRELDVANQREIIRSEEARIENLEAEVKEFSERWEKASPAEREAMQVEFGEAARKVSIAEKSKIELEATKRRLGERAPVEVAKPKVEVAPERAAEAPSEVTTPIERLTEIEGVGAETISQVKRSFENVEGLAGAMKGVEGTAAKEKLLQDLFEDVGPKKAEAIREYVEKIEAGETPIERLREIEGVGVETISQVKRSFENVEGLAEAMKGVEGTAAKEKLLQDLFEGVGPKKAEAIREYVEKIEAERVAEPIVEAAPERVPVEVSEVAGELAGGRFRGEEFRVTERNYDEIYAIGQEISNARLEGTVNTAVAERALVTIAKAEARHIRNGKGPIEALVREVRLLEESAVALRKGGKIQEANVKTEQARRLREENNLPKSVEGRVAEVRSLTSDAKQRLAERGEIEIRGNDVIMEGKVLSDKALEELLNVEAVEPVDHYSRVERIVKPDRVEHRFTEETVTIENRESIRDTVQEKVREQIENYERNSENPLDKKVSEPMKEALDKFVEDILAEQNVQQQTLDPNSVYRAAREIAEILRFQEGGKGFGSGKNNAKNSNGALHAIENAKRAGGTPEDLIWATYHDGAMTGRFAQVGTTALSQVNVKAGHQLAGRRLFEYKMENSQVGKDLESIVGREKIREVAEDIEFHDNRQTDFSTPRNAKRSRRGIADNHAAGREKESGGGIAVEGELVRAEFLDMAGLLNSRTIDSIANNIQVRARDAVIAEGARIDLTESSSNYVLGQRAVRKVLIEQGGRKVLVERSAEYGLLEELGLHQAPFGTAKSVKAYFERRADNVVVLEYTKNGETRSLVSVKGKGVVDVPGKVSSLEVQTTDGFKELVDRGKVVSAKSEMTSKELSDLWKNNVKNDIAVSSKKGGMQIERLELLKEGQKFEIEIKSFEGEISPESARFISEYGKLVSYVREVGKVNEISREIELSGREGRDVDIVELRDNLRKSNPDIARELSREFDVLESRGVKPEDLIELSRSIDKINEQNVKEFSTFSERTFNTEKSALAEREAIIRGEKEITEDFARKVLIERFAELDPQKAPTEAEIKTRKGAEAVSKLLANAKERFDNTVKREVIEESIKKKEAEKDTLVSKLDQLNEAYKEATTTERDQILDDIVQNLANQGELILRIETIKDFNRGIRIRQAERTLAEQATREDIFGEYAREQQRKLEEVKETNQRELTDVERAEVESKLEEVETAARQPKAAEAILDNARNKLRDRIVELERKNQAELTELEKAELKGLAEDIAWLENPNSFRETEALVRGDKELSIGEVEIASKNNQFTEGVGGDYTRTITRETNPELAELLGENVIVLNGDAIGKGVTGSVQKTVVHRSIEKALRREAELAREAQARGEEYKFEPDKFLDAVRKDLPLGISEGATMSAAVIEPNGVYRVAAGGDIIIKGVQTLDISGTSLLPVFELAPQRTSRGVAEGRLQPGESLVLTSDGIPEWGGRGKTGRVEFGAEGIQESIVRSRAEGRTAKETADRLLEDVNAWSRQKTTEEGAPIRREDDIGLVVIKRKGKLAEAPKSVEKVPEDYYHGSNSGSLVDIIELGLRPYGEIPQTRKPFTGELAQGIMEGGINIEYVSTVEPRFFDRALDYATTDIRKGWTPEIGRKKLEYLREQQQILDKGETIIQPGIDPQRQREFIEGKIKIEQLRLERWKTLSEIEKALIREPFSVMYGVKYKGETAPVVSTVAGEKAIPGVAPENLVIYVAKNKVNFVKELVRRSGKDIQVESFESLEGTPLVESLQQQRALESTLRIDKQVSPKVEELNKIIEKEAPREAPVAGEAKVPEAKPVDEVPPFAEPVPRTITQALKGINEKAFRKLRREYGNSMEDLASNLQGKSAKEIQEIYESTRNKGVKNTLKGKRESKLSEKDARKIKREVDRTIREREAAKELLPENTPLELIESIDSLKISETHLEQLKRVKVGEKRIENMGDLLKELTDNNIPLETSTINAHFNNKGVRLARPETIRVKRAVVKAEAARKNAVERAAELAKVEAEVVAEAAKSRLNENEINQIADAVSKRIKERQEACVG